jgi:long-subunit fatty acid transport protein
LNRKGRARRAAPAVLLALSALSLALPPAHASNGVAPIAVSGRAAGRGGADTAFADDALSIPLNPAGMLQSGRWRFDLQDMIVYARDNFVNERNKSLSADTTFFVPALGAIVDPSQADGDFRFGLALAIPYGGGGDKNVKTDLYPKGEKESIFFADIRIGPALAVRPLPGLRIGAGAFYDYLMFETQTTASSSGGSAKGIVRRHRNPDGTPVDPPLPVTVDGQPITFGDLFSLASTPDSNSDAIAKLEKAAAHGFSANIGIQWDARADLTFGLAYSSPAYFGPIEGTARIDATDVVDAIRSDPDIAAITGFLFDTFLPDGNARTFRARYRYTAKGYQSPMSASAGLAWRPVESVAIGLDGRWINYSAALKELDVKLRGGSNANLNEINGGDEIHAKVKLEWKDMWVAALGASVSPVDSLTLRLGYNYSTNPIKKNRNAPGRPTYNHHVAGGFTIGIGENAGISAALVYALPSQTENGRDPVSPQYSFSRFKAEQLFVYVGLSIDIW